MLRNPKLRKIARGSCLAAASGVVAFLLTDGLPLFSATSANAALLAALAGTGLNALKVLLSEAQSR